jgi:hypothetical protein
MFLPFRRFSSVGCTVIVMVERSVGDSESFKGDACVRFSWIYDSLRRIYLFSFLGRQPVNDILRD